MHVPASRRYAIQLGVCHLSTSAARGVQAGTDHLAELQPQLNAGSDGQAVLRLTVAAADLWLALLLAMSVTTGKGYSPQWIGAEPLPTAVVRGVPTIGHRTRTTPRGAQHAPRTTMASTARAADAQTFALSLGLGRLPAAADMVRAEFGDRLAEHDGKLIDHPDDQVELLLTIVADDVWVAALSALSATTAAGYPAARIVARPAD